MDMPRFLAALAAHRAARAAAIGGPAGWRAIVAQHLLEDGTTEVDGVGVVALEGTAVRVGVGAGAIVLADEGVVPLVDGRTERTVQRVVRGGRVALRVREPGPAAITELLAWAPDPAWRLEATWEPLAEPRVVEIAYTIGTTGERRARGRLTFDAAGARHAVLAFDEERGRLFVPFRDATAGRTSYGAGRYLWCDAPGADGRTVLDFNRAESPACAFTPHAACPIPPRDNWLAFAIEAGERSAP